MLVPPLGHFASDIERTVATQARGAAPGASSDASG